jgi:hypothetical protein
LGFDTSNLTEKCSGYAHRFFRIGPPSTDKSPASRHMVDDKAGCDVGLDGTTVRVQDWGLWREDVASGFDEAIAGFCHGRLTVGSSKSIPIVTSRCARRARTPS